MDEATLRALLEQVREGRVEIDSAVEELRDLPYTDLGFAKIDHHRELRSGLAESVFGPGKTAGEVAAIAKDLAGRTSGAVLITRATTGQFDEVHRILPEAIYYPRSGMIVAKSASEPLDGVVLVAAAGTADLGPAEEAAVTAEALGAKVETITDVGVAGVHRLLAQTETLARADVVIAVAGMEGALASLIGGLTKAPVIAVPTSTNYGAGAGGVAPAIAMLNSCAPGVVVVNIDNGYGAAVAAVKVLLTARR